MTEITEKQQKVYKYYLEHPQESQKDIAKHVGVSTATVRKTFSIFNIVRKRVNFKGRKYNAGDCVGSNGCILLERTFITQNDKWKGKFLCSCGETFEAIISDVASGRCKSCGHEREHQIGELLGDNKHKLLRRIRRIESLSHTWVCEFECGLCGRKFQAVISRIVQNSVVSCGCTTMSKGETRVRNILEELGIDFIYEFVFSDCKNPKTNNCLRFDFYLPSYNTCIEYDGEQHFEEAPTLCSDSLKDRQERDNIKNQYCEKHNIHLIRIPYWDFKILDANYLLEKLSLDKE